MPLIFAIALIWAGAGSAAAHGLAPLPPDALWLAWSLKPSVLVPLIIAHWLYGRGVLRLWARAGEGRGLGRRHVLSFLAGEAVLVAALVSPIDALGGTLLSAHMLQHALLVIAAPPLLIAGRPDVALAWGLPLRWRRRALVSLWRPLARPSRRLLRPLPVAALHALTLWAWHAPRLFEAALDSVAIHWIEHATFLATALLFWRIAMRPRAACDAAWALAAVFVTLLHSGLLGALLTLAPGVLYSSYGDRAQLWGIDPISDQQLAGLIMWVPMGVAYLAAALVLAGRMLALASEPPQPWNRRERRALAP